MFKLKLINKPKMIKLKCGFSFPNIVLANLQEKETTPTKEMQQIIADQQYDGLSKVTVNPIPDEYIIPSGEINISQNGTYDVTDKASANVNIPEKVLGTKSITSNGTYKAVDDNLDGYSQVEVETSGVNINDYFNTSINSTYYNSGVLDAIKKIPKFTFSGTSTNKMFSGCTRVTEIDLVLFDTSKTTNFSSMFETCRSCPKILNTNGLDTSKGTRFSYMFSSWDGVSNFDLDLSWLNMNSATSIDFMFNYNLAKTINLSNASFEKVTNISNMFSGASSLENLILKSDYNLGKGYSTTVSENYYSYTFGLNNCSRLTKESLMGIINGLYDIKTAGVKPQQLILGSTNLAKLTSEEIAIATNKGFSVS